MNEERNSEDVSPEKNTSEPLTYSGQLSSTSPPLHTYNVYYGKWHANLIFCTKTPIYLASVSEYTSNKPDVTLHDICGLEKEDTNAPVIAVAHFRWSRDIKLGLGDPLNNPNGMIWEEMRNSSKFYTHTKYQFEFASAGSNLSTFPVPSSYATTPFITTSTRRTYCWQRTNSTLDGVSAWAKASLGNYKLIDLARSETIAVFLSNGAKSWKKAGKLRIKDDVDKKLEIIIVLGAASLAEKLRRRTKWTWMAGASTAGP